MSIIYDHPGVDRIRDVQNNSHFSQVLMTIYVYTVVIQGGIKHS